MIQILFLILSKGREFAKLNVCSSTPKVYLQTVFDLFW